ncbi:uncharacterized protein isoform X3 [Salmo salar]|uniref:Uncharacterized protein isoform X3 n=1 Tax=Salmo salar TaxID=8030 RepID=A0ABM3DNY6_SALSA|nr:uncharacterized protein LOC123729556 isoform X3 [Salmo salar]
MATIKKFKTTGTGVNLPGIGRMFILSPRTVRNMVWYWSGIWSGIGRMFILSPRTVRNMVWYWSGIWSGIGRMFILSPRTVRNMVWYWSGIWSGIGRMFILSPRTVRNMVWYWSGIWSGIGHMFILSPRTVRNMVWYWSGIWSGIGRMFILSLRTVRNMVWYWSGIWSGIGHMFILSPRTVRNMVWYWTHVYLVSAHSEEYGLRGIEQFEGHSWRITEFSHIFGSPNLQLDATSMPIGSLDARKKCLYCEQPTNVNSWSLLNGIVTLIGTGAMVRLHENTALWSRTPIVGLASKEFDVMGLFCSTGHGALLRSTAS